MEPENAGALCEGLRRVLINSDLKSSLSENGYSRMMDRFSFDRTGAAYHKAFASLLGLPNLPIKFTCRDLCHSSS